MMPSHPEWMSPSSEGQLSIDVFRDKDTLVVRSTVAGVRPEDVDVSIHGDLLTIRGKRSMGDEVADENWYYRECYWGAFSRSVVLPHDVSSDSAKASLKNGILEVRIPIRDRGKKVDIQWQDGGS